MFASRRDISPSEPSPVRCGIFFRLARFHRRAKMGVYAGRRTPELPGKRNGMMGARYLLIASTSLCLLPGIERADAQNAPLGAQALPPIVVTGTKPSVKRSRPEAATRVSRAVPKPVVVPTAPLPGV